MSSFSSWPLFEKKVHKIQEWFGYRYSKGTCSGLANSSHQWCMAGLQQKRPPNPSLQTAEGRHWAPGLSKFWTFASISFPPSKLLGLANTRISTGYAQKYPRSLVSFPIVHLSGASTGSPLRATTGRPSRHGPPGPRSDPVNARCRGQMAGDDSRCPK